jgi:hypothetical protein
MPFSSLEIYISHSVTTLVGQFHTAGIEMLYSKYLRGDSFRGFHSINILFSDTREAGKTVVFGKSIHYYSLFDFSAFAAINDPYSKKLHLLDVIHNASLQLAAQEGWETQRFEQAYKQCIASGLGVKWNFKNKLFLAPNRKHYFSLLHVVEFGSFEIFEVLYNKSKEEIFRRLCFSDTVSVFVIQWAAWSDDSTDFYYRFFTNSKTFYTAKVTDLLKKRNYSMSRDRKALLNSRS